MRVPLHPGTFLDDTQELRKLQLEWLLATAQERQAIVSNILYEIEAFGDCYRIEQLPFPYESSGEFD